MNDEQFNRIDDHLREMKEDAKHGLVGIIIVLAFILITLSVIAFS